MANLPESATFEPSIYQLEETDPVQGGPEGIDNLQAKQLANRTSWLKEEVEKRAPNISPNLEGTPTAQTAEQGTDSTQLATTAFVQAALELILNAPPAALDTLNELAAALGDDENFAATVNTALAARLQLAGGTLSGFLSLHADPTSSMHAVTKQYFDANGVPPGVITYAARDTVLDGYLAADGSAISRTTYANLHSVLGSFWGAGDGVNTFNLPDLRGQFIRGWDNGRGIDPGRAFGTEQADDFKSHTHTAIGGDIPFPSFSGISAPGNNSQPASDMGIQAAGGTETRPRNIALQIVIKY